MRVEIGPPGLLRLDIYFPATGFVYFSA